MKKVFLYDRFAKLVDNVSEIEEITKIDTRAFYILDTIDGYIDCLGSFVNEITAEEVDAALEMLEEGNLHKIYDMNRCASAISIAAGTKIKPKVDKKDLF